MMAHSVTIQTCRAGGRLSIGVSGSCLRCNVLCVRKLGITSLLGIDGDREPRAPWSESRLLVGGVWCVALTGTRAPKPGVMLLVAFSGLTNNRL
jgi:hypothetical protein